MDVEMTPTANVAFNGVVADELSRLYREIKELNNKVEQATFLVRDTTELNGKLLTENRRLRTELEGAARQTAELMRRLFLAENELSVIKKRKNK